MTAKAWNLRRSAADALLTITALAIVIATILAVNEKAREKVNSHMDRTQIAADAGGVVSEVQRTVARYVGIAKAQTSSEPTIMIFLGLAAVLTVFMFRT